MDNKFTQFNDRYESGLTGGQLYEVSIPHETQKVNDIGEVTISYNIDENYINPFKVKDLIVLDKQVDKRYENISSNTNMIVGRVSKILGKSLVNISFATANPPTVKNVSIKHIKLHKPTLSRRIKFFFSNLGFVKKLRKKFRR